MGLKKKKKKTQECSVKLFTGFRTCFMFQSEILNQLLAALFQHVTGSEILWQGEGTSFPRPSASSSLGFAFLPFCVKIFQV